MHLDNMGEWLLKCFFYFLPVLLMVIRYTSFLVDKKKTVSDVIVDGQFCIIPFCFALDSIIGYLRKAGETDEGLELYGIAANVVPFIAALLLLLLYWDLSYVSIQRDGELDGRVKKMTEIMILTLTGIAIAAYFLAGCCEGETGENENRFLEYRGVLLMHQRQMNLSN